MAKDLALSDEVDMWLDAAAVGSGCATALEGVYGRCAAAIEARGPVCWASGRCCNFDGAGHLLYTTGLEVAYAVVRAGPVPAPAPTLGPDGGDAGESEERGGGSDGLALPQVSRFPYGPACPYQVRNLCTMHLHKPLGCRIYFCDRSAQQWQQNLHEELLTEVRRIHDQYAVPYRYAEWRGQLEVVMGVWARRESDTERRGDSDTSIQRYRAT